MIVPAFNAGPDLACALQSVLAQTESNWECLVVDDGSTDGTTALVRDFEARDSRFRLIVQENQGVGAARNEGINQARGEFVAPLDADDLWHSEKLRKQLLRMDAVGPDCGMVYCWWNRINEAGEFMWHGHPFEAEGRVFVPLLMWNFIGNASVPLFRTSVLREVGCYLTRDDQGGGQGCEDWDLSLRIASVATVSVEREFLVDYRQVPQCMSCDTLGMEKSYRVLTQRLESYESEIPEKLYRWSAGHFYSYLTSKAFLGERPGEVFRCIGKSMASDHAMLFNGQLYKYGAKTILRLILRDGLGLNLRGLRNAIRRQRPDSASHELPQNCSLNSLEESRWATAMAIGRGGH
ncbi:glycosyltransferase family 2 protein [Haloferula sp.]|uniref:glycosyltransferase family 2 protein n=1 Tax=Haloferula sp. TaxID=2497595 RepID=UPI00329D951A